MNNNALNTMFLSQNNQLLSQEIIPSQNYATQGDEEKRLGEVSDISEIVPSPKEYDTFSFKPNKETANTASKNTNSGTPAKERDREEVKKDLFGSQR